MLKKFIKNNLTLSLLLVLSLIIIINNFFRFFQNNSVFEFDPWLSNYQGGFVRRGIPGEIFYQIYNFLHIHPGWMVFIFVSILYILFYLNFFNLIKNLKLNRLYVFIIFSPIAFYFPILNSKASGHKEILLLFFLSLFCLLLPKINKKKAILFIIFISIILGLSYEVLIFYLPYLFIPFIYFFKFKNFKDLFLCLTPILLVSLTLILINYHFSGTDKHVVDICNSIKQYVNNDCQIVGKIADLGLIIEGHTSQKANWDYGKSSLYPAYYKIYRLGFVVGFLPLFILYNRIKITKFPIKYFKPHPIFILFFLQIFAFPVYYLGADWGRYLYTAYMSSIIFTFFCIKNKIFIYENKITPNKNNIIMKYVFIITLFFYCLGWTVPICCEKKFKPGLTKVIERGEIYYKEKLLNEY